MFDWQDNDGLLAAQLQLQVRIQFSAHHEFLLAHNLTACRTVLEIGVGDGTFLRQLALTHPRIAFLGVDNSADMIRRAPKGAPANMRCAYGDARDFLRIPQIGDVDGAIMRYVLLHLVDKASILGNLHNALRPGARIWLIDLDLEQFASDPPSVEFDWVREQVRVFCAGHGLTSNYGSEFVAMLENAGFHDVRKEIERFDNTRIDPGEFAQFIRNEVTLYRRALSSPMSAAEAEALEKFLRSLADQRVRVNYGVSLITALT